VSFDERTHLVAASAFQAENSQRSRINVFGHHQVTFLRARETGSMQEPSYDRSRGNIEIKPRFVRSQKIKGSLVTDLTIDAMEQADVRYELGEA